MTHFPNEQRDNLGERGDALVITPSGLTERRYQLERTFGGECAAALDAAVSPGDSFETLVVTQDGYTEVVFADPTAQEPNTSTVLDRLAVELEARLPDWIGLARGTYDLSALGTAPLPTSRVVRDAGVTGSLGNLFRAVVESNESHAVGTVGQLLCSRRHDGRFSVVCRVASDSFRAAPLGRRALTAAVAEPPVDALAKELPGEYRSSRELVQLYWETRESPLRSLSKSAVLHVRRAGQLPKGELEEFVQASPAARRALTLASGTRAYDNLLHGRSDPALYDPLEVEPTLTVSTSTLADLLAVVPLYTGTPIRGGGARSAPAFEPVETLREAVASPPRSKRSTQRRSPSPTSLLAWVEQWCREQSPTVTTVEDRSRGSPHLRGSPYGEAAPVVIVDPSASSTDPAVSAAGELIMVANRAVRAGEQLLVVTPSPSAAAWAGRVLAVPYDRVLETGHTVLYTVPDLIPDGTGGVFVRSQSSPTPTWQVSPESTKRLVSGGEVLAEGSLSTPLTELSFVLPRFSGDGDQIRVSRPDGRTDTFDTVAECTEEYAGISRPVGSVWPTFRGLVTVSYRDGHRLYAHRPDTQWSQSTAPATDLQTAIQTFVSTYTVQSTGTGAAQFNQVLDGWLHDQLDCQMPPEAMLALRLPARVSPRTGPAGDITALHGRDWRVPMVGCSLDRVNARTEAR
ncbi:hypothetical protein [Halorubrum sp. F4]|uniref:hypothetical protein n=1 Tax=Halorubrum sp. F4 TaxID=2989715 RepID=UPI002480DED0|nr:hypothetical protein [Halorubrum sp. F4]